MYKIEHISNSEKALEHIELIDSKNNSRARIFLNLGGSLQVLSLKNKSIIKDLAPLHYNTTYASAILFPFANRIKNGTYTFLDKDYTLNLNLKEENNAIHGLVYNKSFKIIRKEVTDDFATITIGFNETKKVKGFPFKYAIHLTYWLTENAITLKVLVKNNDQSAFPFNIGWHPYFYSRNLYDSVLSLESDKKLVLNEDMIPQEIKDISIPNHIQIKNRVFDDCYILNSKSVSFKTPDYNIVISSTSNENYLQVFTPNKPNTIAIEPKTGPSNSFNNKLGLSVLKPNESYEVSWTIKLKENE